MTDAKPNLLSGRFMQIGYVTTDLSRALDVFARQGVSKFLRSNDACFDVGQGRQARCHVGLAFSGGLQIEVIEPVGGAVEVFRAPFKGDGYQLHFHHQCHWLDTEDEFRSMRQAMRASGHDIVIDGSFPGAMFFYADFRGELGHFVEYVRFDPEMFRQLRAAIPDN